MFTTPFILDNPAKILSLKTPKNKVYGLPVSLSCFL